MAQQWRSGGMGQQDGGGGSGSGSGSMAVLTPPLPLGALGPRVEACSPQTCTPLVHGDRYLRAVAAPMGQELA